MRLTTRKGLAVALMATAMALMLVACGGDEDEGALTQAQIEEIVRQEMANNQQTVQGPSSADVEAMIAAAMADDKDAAEEPEPETTPTDGDGDQPDTGMSREEVEAMISASATRTAGEMDQMTQAEAEAIALNVIASIPSKTDLQEYTKYVVRSAINRYETHGRDATVEHYMKPANVDGQWYVFIIGEDDSIISHYNPDRLGLDLNGWVGTDANGYNFGPKMLAATEEGNWVSYVYRNPESGALIPGSLGQEELKNAWVVRHDGLLFGSGWYINSDEFTEAGVREAVAIFREGGLEGIFAHYLSGDSNTVGALQDTVAYYNSAQGVGGNWYAFIADRDGVFISHLDTSQIGSKLTDLFGPEGVQASREGGWVTKENEDGSLAYRVWLIDDAGLTFGSGWFDD